MKDYLANARICGPLNGIFSFIDLFSPPIPPYPLLNWQDILDILALWCSSPLLGDVPNMLPAQNPRRGSEITFMVLAALWASGQACTWLPMRSTILIEGFTKTA
jgi:hypothetical protein